MIRLEIAQDGTVRMLHDDRLDLSSLGQVEVARASHVEFDNATGRWFVQSARTLAVLRADFRSRADALAWEKQHYSPGGAGWRELTEAK